MARPGDSVWEKKIEPRLDEIAEWYSKGYTRASIAESLGIGDVTLYRYARDKEELKAIFEKAEETRLNLIEDKLFKRANGYDKTLTKKTYRYVYDHDGNATRKLEKEEENVIHVQPDVSAQMAILRSKRKNVWGDSIKLETETESGVIVMPVRQIVEEKDGQAEDQ